MAIRLKQICRATALNIVILFLANPVFSHVEKGHMPDAVAEVEYKILLEFKPGDIDTRTKLALVLIRQGKLGDAEKELEKAAAKSPEDFRVHEGYIVLRLKQQKIDAALDLAEESLKTYPDKAILYLHYGKALEAKGHSGKALTMYQTGLEMTIGMKESHDREQLEEAIQKIKSVQSQNTGNNK